MSTETITTFWLLERLSQAFAALGWSPHWMLARLDMRLHWPAVAQERVLAAADDALPPPVSPNGDAAPNTRDAFCDF